MESQEKLDNFLDGFGVGQLEEGEEIDIPYKR